jgi:hypothetical protein
MVGYMDGYFLANEKNTPKMWFSNLMNGLTWSATDFFTRSSTSDNLVGFAVNNRRIWALGSKTTELFQDSGDATTPFIPIPGSVMNEGTNSYQSITTIADTVFWVGSTKEFGHAQIFAGAGLQPRVISTPPISYAISASTNIAEAEALSYTQRGHVFICWTWPSLNGGRGQTWCYDLTEEAWHQRATWAAAGGDFQYLRWSARASCAFANPASGLLAAPLVGQVDSFWLCTLSLDTYTDQLPGTPSTTQPIIRLRTAPYLSAENQWFFLQQIELGIEASLGGLTAPNVMLRLNPNNGASASWTPFMPAAIGLQVDGQAVAQWFQLGRARADRLVLQIVQNNAAPCVWGPGLYLRASPGTGQL